MLSKAHLTYEMAESDRSLYVIKRGKSLFSYNLLDARRESVQCHKITKRILNLCDGLDRQFIDPESITARVVTGLYAGVTTVELDNLAAEVCASMTTRHHDYATLAARCARSI
ncbi:unnamed protein product [Protopolystoma xenopodis]|uniref:Ribonucleoside-diphosphate reductase large subunit n=1 Tax=Protopolystoma xenopodis TaxID=117903 RepID=A0A448X1Z4_9PLAT|nr:unnamed protein product [Protopolystoma xenopodis]